MNDLCEWSVVVVQPFRRENESIRWRLFDVLTKSAQNLELRWVVGLGYRCSKCTHCNWIASGECFVSRLASSATVTSWSLTRGSSKIELVTPCILASLSPTTVPLASSQSIVVGRLRGRGREETYLIYSLVFGSLDLWWLSVVCLTMCGLVKGIGRVVDWGLVIV